MKKFDESKCAKYYVNKKGEVFSKFLGKLRRKKITVHSRGYAYVRTVNRNYQLHRIVASAFLKNPLNKPCINHKDGDKLNNKVENLEWVTYKENAQHALKIGLSKLPKKNEGPLKYSNKECKDVLKRVASGMTYLEAGKKYLMPYSTVAHLARGSRRLIS